MTFARRRASLPILGLLALAGCKPASTGHEQAPARQGDKPELLLLTSLPILFGETFSIEAAGSPVLDALERRYRVRPVSTSSAEALEGASLLLMAHPLAQPAEDLVALDRWVREGGKLVLLADPMLEWPDSRALTDPTRPPPMFMDTGLLKHWGLRLEAPEAAGPVSLGGGHQPVVFQSPGRLVAEGGNCSLSRAGIVAQCRIGKGRVIVFADADFIRPGLANERESFAANQTGELLWALDRLDGR